MLGKRIVAGTFVISLAVIVVGAVVLNEPTTSSEQTVRERTTDVKTVEVTPELLKEWIELPGEVEPYIATEVPAEVGGRIDWIGPKEGDLIEKAGAPILRIDQRTFQAQVDEARAAYELAANHCKRAEELHQRGIISNEQLDQCKAEVATSAARLEMAQVQLQKATVRAPMVGVLNKSYFEVGEYVNPGARVADIVVIDPIKILVKTPEKDIPYVHLGQKAGLTFKLLEGKTYEAAVTYISVVGDRATRTYEVELTVANPAREILPSMIATVKILRREIPDALTVPLFSVIPRGDYKSVFVEKNGRAEERQVELGILDGDRVQILTGLHPHDRLIVEGHRELADGAAVRVQGALGAAS
ncbi:MAG: efflux RND transporter periplasmic adaptor subunit [Candidatus Abyssubacteria bacterium]